jgi:DNA polymerase II large subunit
MSSKFNFICSEEMELYFSELKTKADRCYEIARNARSKGFDPELEPEVIMTEDLAARAEGLVGPEGIAQRIRELGKDISNREILSLTVAREIVKEMRSKGKKEAADQAIRTGLAILTEAVLVAPIEGIAKIDIEKNTDGSDFLSIYFAGPIRSAGGTGQAMSVLIGDVVRRELGLDKYKPTTGEIERMKEEIPLYKRAQHLQYEPSVDEIDAIVRNCPVCVDGEGTEEEEVSGYRNLPRIKTPRLRGGACLVIAEGLCLKAKKIQKNVKALELEGWEFIDKIANKGMQKDTDLQPKGLEECPEDEKVCEPVIKPNEKYMRDSLAGRPIFAGPSTCGGFRLRYGRARTTGLAALAFNPITMFLLGEFLAVGTQMKIERPGKAGVATSCDQIEGPIVLLNNQNLVQINTLEQARNVKDDIIAFTDLGEILVPFGEFVENNHLLVPGAYDIQWWHLDLENQIKENNIDSSKQKSYEKLIEQSPTSEQAFELSSELDIPLHPDYNLFWNDITMEQFGQLREHIENYGKYDDNRLEIPNNDNVKKTLVELGALHTFDSEQDKIVFSKYSLPLIRCFGLDEQLKSIVNYDDIIKTTGNNVLRTIENLTGIKIHNRAPTRIGASMGRPEKAKERMMKPPVHALFPLGSAGGTQRLVKTAAENNKISVEVGLRECTECGKLNIFSNCDCGGHTIIRKNHGVPNLQMQEPVKQTIPIKQLLLNAQKRLEIPQLPHMKGVIGLISQNKTPEPLEKGILRAKNEVFVFKDGTTRFDMTDVPLTHFKPKEIGTSIEKLIEMGYTHDHKNKPLTNEEQIIELKPQDIIPSNRCGVYLLKVSKFLDDLLTRFYKLDSYYNASTPKDIIGQIVMGLSPHTSGAVLGRIIGYTRSRVGYAHPFFHAAKRRNCDGDEDCVMLFLDGLINFSKSYLPGSRGGFMDAPLVLMTYINPNEIDKEAQNVDILSKYPLKFYQAAEKYASPKELEDIMETVGDRLGTPGQFENFGFMYDTGDINIGPEESAYTRLGSMEEKMKAQLELARQIRAVDESKVAAKIIETHFLPDMIGNLNQFSRQRFRCPKCRAKYRRMPLKGVCIKRKPDGEPCGNKLSMTVHEGGVKKYLLIAKNVAEEFNVSKYTQQRILLNQKAIDSTFENDKVKKFTLDEFI